MTLISVLIPVYNCGEFLETALNSISRQTYENFEAIVVDDGSTDGSGDVLRAHAERDRRFHVITITNGGIVRALNTGLAQVRGTYTARMDGDDIARADRFEKQLAFLESKPDYVSVGSLYRVIDSRGKVVGAQAPFKRFPQTDLQRFPPHVASTPHPSTMFRTEALKAINGYRTQFPHAEDYDMFIRLSRRGRVGIIQEQLLDYRIHDRSVSTANIDIQTRSSTLAVLSAITVAAGKDDPCDTKEKVDFRDFYDAIAEPGFEAAFEEYRYFRKIASHFNRWQKREGRQLISAKLLELLRQLPVRAGDWRYRGILSASAYLTLRAWLGRA